MWIVKLRLTACTCTCTGSHVLNHVFVLNDGPHQSSHSRTGIYPVLAIFRYQGVDCRKSVNSESLETLEVHFFALRFLNAVGIPSISLLQCPWGCPYKPENPLRPNNSRDWISKSARLKGTTNRSSKKWDIGESRMIVYSVVVIMCMPRF